MWPDIAGLRDAYKEMARRLAGAGHAVLVVNHYYRTNKAPIFETISQWRTPEGQARLRPAFAPLSRAGTERDAQAFVAWLDSQKVVDTRRKIGTAGYCMTGPYTVITAAAVPERIGAACSFHGGGLVTDQDDSPHRLFAKARASFLIAIARNDDAKAPGEKDVLREAAKAAGRKAEIEVYQADHGWCTLDAPVYDRGEADRAWGRMLALFKAL
jgi:carboxymethylenebutenolidase